MRTVNVTTVMPAYNEGDRLSAFLQDWASEGLRQTSTIVTALVVDDGSKADQEARQRQAVDAVCGSRVKMAGRSVERSLFRHVQGRTFATGVEELFHLGFYDSQCGLKFFQASLLRPVLPQLQENRWLLDIEVLVLLREARARFTEVPIDCHQRGGSSLVFGIDPLKMAVRLVRLRARLRRQSGNPR